MEIILAVFNLKFFGTIGFIPMVLFCSDVSQTLASHMSSYT